MSVCISQHTSDPHTLNSVAKAVDWNTKWMGFVLTGRGILLPWSSDCHVSSVTLGPCEANCDPWSPLGNLAQVATKGLCCLNQWGHHCFLSLYSHQVNHTDLLQGILTLWRGEDPFGSLVKLMDPLSVIFLLMHKIKYIRLWGKLYWNPPIKILKTNCNIMM